MVLYADQTSRIVDFLRILYTPIEYNAMIEQRESVLRRLKRIEGQVRGLAGMVEQERYCVDVLQQISAVRAALGKVEDEVLKMHAASCVEDAIRSGSVREQRKKFDELVDLFGRVKK